MIFKILVDKKFALKQIEYILSKNRLVIQMRRSIRKDVHVKSRMFPSFKLQLGRIGSVETIESVRQISSLIVPKAPGWRLPKAINESHRLLKGLL